MKIKLIFCTFHLHTLLPVLYIKESDISVTVKFHVHTSLAPTVSHINIVNVEISFIPRTLEEQNYWFHSTTMNFEALYFFSVNNITSLHPDTGATAEGLLSCKFTGNKVILWTLGAEGPRATDPSTWTSTGPLWFIPATCCPGLLASKPLTSSLFVIQPQTVHHVAKQPEINFLFSMMSLLYLALLSPGQHDPSAGLGCWLILFMDLGLWTFRFDDLSVSFSKPGFLRWLQFTKFKEV